MINDLRDNASIFIWSLDLKKSELVYLAAILLLSGFALLYGLNGDSPYCMENDEICYAPVSIEMVTKHTIDPGWYINPASTTMYPLAAYYSLLKALTGNQIIDPSLTPLQMCFKHMDTLIKWPRLTSVAFVLLSLPLLYVIGRRWVGKTATMLGVGFYALSPLVVYYGQILRPDMLAVFLILLSVFLLDFLCEEPTNKPLTVALGVLAGLAMSTRFFCLALVVPPATVFGTALLRQADGQKKPVILKNLFYFFVTWFTTFFATSPFVFFNFHQLLEDMKFEAQSDFAELTGLGPFGNLQFYFVEGLPESIGYWLAGAVVVGLLFICFKPTFKTIVYLTLLTVLFAGTCLNPRHWVRWILPMLPLLSLLAGFAITTTYKLIVRLLSKFTPETVANNCSFIIVIAFVIYGWFFPIRHLIYDQYQKGQLSARAEAYPWMLAHIPKHTKIVVDTGWDWPKVEDYNVTSNIWRPDFVPPRPHNYYFPEDLAKEGFEYMVVETWNRDYYQWDESEKKYPREHAFYKRLREDAPLVLNTFDENRPWILGHILPYRVSPIEIYDLRPLARKKLHAP